MSHRCDNRAERFIPCRGNRYDETRLLLLGESAYSWQDKNGIWHDPEPKLPKQLVDEQIKGFDAVRFARCLSRGLAGEESPNGEQLRSVWDRVAFTNYVNGTVGRGPENRPTPEMWDAARRAFPSLLADLKPQRVIVFGKEMWSEMPPTNVAGTDEMQGYTLDNGEKAMCWALRHPRAQLSWRSLANVIRIFCPGTFPGPFHDWPR